MKLPYWARLCGGFGLLALGALGLLSRNPGHPAQPTPKPPSEPEKPCAQAPSAKRNATTDSPTVEPPACTATTKLKT